jgi:Regulator of ribonuclease activity B
MPRSLDDELTATAEQVDRRVAMGDAVETPRSVEHLALLPHGRARAAQDDLRAAGFEIISTRRRLFRTAVEFSRMDAVDSHSAAAFTRQIATLVATHGGEYDGWGGFAVSAEQEQPDEHPADSVPVAQVVEADEQARLRHAFVERMLADGCDHATAQKLASKIQLRVQDGSYSVDGPAGGLWHEGDYSPSEVTEHVQGQAEQVIQDNRGRRKPRWPSTGGSPIQDPS